MLDPDDLWLMDEELSRDESSDLLETMPGIRQWLDFDRHDGELGLRCMLERPEWLAKSWWRTANGHPDWVKRHVDGLCVT